MTMFDNLLNVLVQDIGQDGVYGAQVVQVLTGYVELLLVVFLERQLRNVLVKLSHCKCADSPYSPPGRDTS